MNQFELSFTAETIDSLLTSLFNGSVFGGELSILSEVPKDTKQFYVALREGVYMNFGFTLEKGEFAFVWYDGRWKYLKDDLSMFPRVLKVSDIKRLTEEQCESLRIGDIVVGDIWYTVINKDNLSLLLSSISNTTIVTVGYLYMPGDGWLYAQTNTADPNDKADKVNNATNGNFAGIDSNGNLTDSGYKPSDFVLASTFNETIQSLQQQINALK